MRRRAAKKKEIYYGVSCKNCRFPLALVRPAAELAETFQVICSGCGHRAHYTKRAIFLIEVIRKPRRRKTGIVRVP